MKGAEIGMFLLHETLYRVSVSTDKQVGITPTCNHRVLHAIERTKQWQESKP